VNTQHILLSGPKGEAPSRWLQAFPLGHVIDTPELVAHFQGRVAAQCLVWLISADPHWSANMASILATLPNAPIVILSNAPATLEGLHALHQGARGYTHAHAVPALLKEVATVVEHGGLWVGPELMQRLVGATNAALAARLQPTDSLNPWATLSAREAQVARAVQAGCSNKEVANQMFISERTVKAHLSIVFEKLNVRDRLQLVLRLATSGEPASASAQDLTP
jgi:two-component system, NarL family, nitrate/nitrite response regulator NarL